MSCKYYLKSMLDRFFDSPVDFMFSNTYTATVNQDKSDRNGFNSLLYSSNFFPTPANMYMYNERAQPSRLLILFH
jgi:hypothetical protein